MDLGWGGRMCAHDCVGVQSRHCHRRTLQVYTSWKEQKWLNLTVCQVWQLDVPRQSDGLICQRKPITAVHEVAIFMQPWDLASHVWTTRTNIHHMYSAKNSFFFSFLFFHYQFKVAPAICVTVSKYLEHEKNSAAQLSHQPTIRLLCYL